MLTLITYVYHLIQTEFRYSSILVIVTRSPFLATCFTPYELLGLSHHRGSISSDVDPGHSFP